jgi:hypothetical protein
MKHRHDDCREVVRRLSLVVLNKIGEESIGPGPARDVLEGFIVALDQDFPELVPVVEEILGGRP